MQNFTLSYKKLFSPKPHFVTTVNQSSCSSYLIMVIITIVLSTTYTYEWGLSFGTLVNTFTHEFTIGNLVTDYSISPVTAATEAIHTLDPLKVIDILSSPLSDITSMPHSIAIRSPTSMVERVLDVVNRNADAHAVSHAKAQVNSHIKVTDYYDTFKAIYTIEARITDHSTALTNDLKARGIIIDDILAEAVPAVTVKSTKANGVSNSKLALHGGPSTFILKGSSINTNLNVCNSPNDGFKINDSPNYGLSMPNVFSVMADNRLKGSYIRETLKEKNKNYAYKPKHFPPANKEWFNSIYAYNNSTAKVLPVADKVILRLVKSYFNFYSKKLEKKVKMPRLRARVRRLSTNRMLVSKAEVKHTGDKAIVTVYVFNRSKKYYFNLIKNIAPIDQMDKYLSTEAKMDLYLKGLPKASAILIRKIKDKALKVRLRLKNHNSRFIKLIKNEGLAANVYKNHETKYLKHYAIKILRKEILSIFYKQLIFFNRSKFENIYVIPFTKLIERVYRKKVEFNFVNLKYLYLNSYLFSDTLVLKLRNRKNRLLRVLRTSLLMFTLPRMDGLAVYNEIYNRKKHIQNLNLNDLKTNNYNLKLKSSSSSTDVLEHTLLKLDSSNSLSFYSNDSLKSYASILNSVFGFLKNKFVSGVRLEVAGRLTRRNTAARAVSKLRYRGNIKDMDSSSKGLSTVMLRGHAKPNLQYSKLGSKIRIGSFGLKG